METIRKPMSDSRIARRQPDGVGGDAGQTQTSDDGYNVISPVPMNPSCIILSCRFQTKRRTDLKRFSKTSDCVCPHLSDGWADTSRIAGRVPQVPFFGTWVLVCSDLFSNLKKRARWSIRPFSKLSPQLVAAACNHPYCLVLPFSVELIRLAVQPACKVIGWRSLPGSRPSRHNRE